MPKQSTRKSLLVISILAVAATLLVLADTGDPNVHQLRYRPLQLGVSGGSIQDSAKIRGTTYCCGGTLGAGVEDATGTKYVLSNNHVLARGGRANIDRAVNHNRCGWNLYAHRRSHGGSYRNRVSHEL